MSSQNTTNLYVTCSIRLADGTTVCKVKGATMEKTIEIMKNTAEIYGAVPLKL